MSDQIPPNEELREKILRWFAVLVSGSPSLEQLSPEQRVSIEALADAIEQRSKEKAIDLNRYHWERPPVHQSR
jgi:hypothetical protein